MKKILVFFFILFLPKYVVAEDILLKELEIKNGELSLPFDAYNTEYTVSLEADIFQLDFSYQVEEAITVAINNNFDLENDSIVTLTVSQNGKKLDYHFHILKENSEVVSVFTTPKVEKEQNFMYLYKQYIIPIICFLLIFLCYKIIFFKHSSKK